MTKISYLIEDGGDGAFIEISPEVDLFFNVSVSSSKTITSIPLESGRPISDNAIEDPLRIRLSGVVSDLVATEGRSHQPKQTWVTLQDLKKRNVLLSLVTELGEYKNLLVQSLGNEENVRTGKSLHFSLNLQQVEFVDAEFTELSKEKVTAEGEAANRTEQVNKGVLNASEA